MKLIGIFGGTFNPVHLGHLHVAMEVLSCTPICEVRFLPCYLPVHRATPEVSADHRLAMLHIALDQHPDLCVDTHELDRQGPSYMIDTLKTLHRESPDERRVLIVGLDAFLGLPGWKDWQQLLDYCHLLVVNRPGAEGMDDSLAAFASTRWVEKPEQLLDEPQGRIARVDIPPSPVSATELRAELAAGVDVSSQLPPGVMAYIAKHKLYRG